MPGVVPAIPRLKFTNAAGVPVASGSVTVYLAGTTTLAKTYQDKALTIENTNPVTLDGNGEALFWLDPSLTYKFLLKDANNANVSGWPVDNILGGGQAPTLQQSHVDQFSANGVNKSFTLSATPGSVYDTNVYVSGVYQEKSTYSLAGPVLTFANAPALGMGNIEVTYYVLLDFTGLAATIAGYSAAASASASDAQTSALAASTSETNAAGSVTAINNRIYPGTYTTAPTTRPDGSARQAGDEYFDATLNKRFTYSSSTWVASDINTANLAAPSGSLLVGFLQAGTGMVARTDQAKQRETLSLQDAGGDAIGTTTDIATFLQTASAAAVAGSTSSKRIKLPAGTFKLASALTLGNSVSIVGDGSLNTIINYYGAGIALTVQGTVECGGFTIVSQAAGQSGMLVKGSIAPRVRDVVLNEFDGTGFQLGVAGTSGVYYADIDGIQCINNTRVGTIGFVIDGLAIPNSNANTARNVVINGMWQSFYDIRGNGNTLIGGDVAPNRAAVQSAGSDIVEVFKIQGIGNKVVGPYVEPVGATYPTCFFRFTGVANSNRVTDVYWTNTDTNSYAKVDDLGIGNEVAIRPNGGNFPQPVGLNNQQHNIVSNAQFLNLNASGVPKGWNVTVTGSSTVARSTAQVRGQPYSLLFTCTGDGHAVINAWPVTDTNFVARNAIQTTPARKVRNRTVTVGVWCYSTTAGFGAIKVYTGSTSLGVASHSGSGAWEFLTASGRVDTAANEVNIEFRSNTSNTNTTGTCYFSEPIMVIGNDIPQPASPRHLNDCDARLGGRLAWSPPATLTVNSATPDVSEGNFFTEANTGATTISNFPGGVAGQEIKILTTSANTTLGQTGTIQTTTGANKALATGTVYKLIFDGTKWREF